jgi:16S rRNA (cytidine1402-2'-O)-methyltransferase
MTPSEAPVGRLVVCPTPIGNLMDVTLRVLEELGRADLIACEDTRHTRTLLDRHGIRANLISLHEHNEAARSTELSRRIEEGETVALVSDAGMPLVSDPGFALVQACIADGLQVEVLPGASAVTTALVASGLPAGRWCFVGFLPRRRGELRDLLAGATDTLVAFESPRRLAATLALLAEIDPGRRAAVCRELTKLHEEVSRGSAAELAARYLETPARGEVVLVLEGGSPEGISREPVVRALRELVDSGARARPAAGALAQLTGLSANDLYRELTLPAE